MKKFAVLLLCLLPLHTLAADFSGNWYQIELIIFSHVTKETLTAEQWPNITITPLPNNLINLTPSTTQNTTSQTAYSLLPDTDFTLNNEVKKLASLPNTHLITHIAWRMPVYDTKNTKPIHILVPNADNTGWQVNGTFTLSVRRFFNAQFTLLFTPSKLMQHAGVPLPNVFRLMQTRRMRSNELNLINHPLYGVLIKITPVDAPTTTQT